MIHCTPVNDIDRSFCSSGTAMATIVWSMNVIATAKIIATRTSRLFDRRAKGSHISLGAMVPYRLMYALGFAPWERRNVPELWRPLFEGPDALEPGRALDVGCGSGRDAVHLAGHGWQVTAIEVVDKALERAKQRAAAEGVEVQWINGSVAELGRLGLEPGYTLLYDFGCIHGLSDSERRGAAAGLTALAAPGARLLLLAFKAARRLALPRGMDTEHLLALLGDGWELQRAESAVIEDMPPPVRRAEPTLFRLRRAGGAASAA
jgi:SAM-dependent methyltransferase